MILFQIVVLFICYLSIQLCLTSQTTDNCWSGSGRADSDEDETHPPGSPRQDLRHALGFRLQVSLPAPQLMCVC